MHLGDHYAVVAQPDGHRYVARSIGTLSYDAGQGRVPVSLALKDRGSDVGPEHSPADVSFPKKGSDRYFFSGGGFGVSVDTAQPTSAQMQGGKMFYPNALPDTDVLAVPTARGLDTYGVVRSANGPEALVLRFDLPPGGALVEHSDPEGTTVGLTRDGQPLASIAPPQAQDAQGVPVPVSYKVEGDRLVVRVAHRSKGYAYPIMIDPSISESAHWRQDGSSDYNGFVNDTVNTPGYASYDHGMGQESPSNPSIWHGGVGFPLESSTDNVYGPNGLYFETEPAPNGLLYHVWQSTAYHYQAPGDAYIYQAQFGYHNAHIAYGTPPGPSAQTPNNSCLYEGIYSPSSAAWEGAWFEPNSAMAGQAPSYVYGGLYVNQPRMMCQFTYADNWKICGYNCQPTNQAGTGPSLTPGNEISIGMFSRANAAPSSTNPNVEDLAYSGSVDWQESDMGRPSFDPSTVPQSDPQWVGNVTRSLSPTATDGGLGVKTAELSTPNTSGGTTVARSDVSCYGNRDYRCPQRIAFDNSTPFYYAAQPLSYNTANMPEGVNTLGLAAVDVVGNASAGTSDNPDFAASQWTVKVDRTPPSNLDASGPLRPDDGWVGGGDQSIDVSADDGVSGVQTLELWINGARVDSATQDCGHDGCSLSHTFFADMNQYADGSYPVVVKAYDQAHNLTQTSWTIKVDKDAPALALSGALKDSSGQTLAPGGTYALDASAADSVGAIQPQSGVKSIEITVDGDQSDFVDQACSTGGCPLDRQWTYNVSEYAPGPHTIEVTAVDFAGNRTVQDISVTNPQDASASCPTMPPPTASVGGVPNTPDLALMGFNASLPEATRSSSQLSLDGDTVGAGLASGSPFAVTQGVLPGSVADHAAGGYTMTSDGDPICVAPASLNVAASDPTLENGTSALIANQAPSTDVMLRPTAVGTDMFEQMRDPTAPTDSAWNVGLGAGQVLELLPNGDAAIVEPAPVGAPPDPGGNTDIPGVPSVADQRLAITDTSRQLQFGSDAIDRASNQTPDTIVAVFPAPWAQDATGASVPASWSVTGSRLTLTVARPVLESSYPVIAEGQQITADSSGRATSLQDDANTADGAQQSDLSLIDEPAPAGFGQFDTASEPAPAPVTPAAEARSQYATPPYTGSDDPTDPAPNDQTNSQQDPPVPGGERDPSLNDRAYAASASSRPPTTIGISDSDPASDPPPGSMAPNNLGPLFQRNTAGKGYVRIVVPWDVEILRQRNAQNTRVRMLDDAERNAQARNYELLVTLETDTTRGKKVPSSAEYGRDVSMFLKAHPYVTHVGSWNEPNLKGNPLHDRLQYANVAARYWTKLERLCHPTGQPTRCVAVAGDFAGSPRGFDTPNARNGYTDLYARYLLNLHRRHKDHLPAVWAWHAHADANAYEQFGSRPDHMYSQIRAPRITVGYHHRFGNAHYGNPFLWVDELSSRYHESCKELKNVMKDPNRKNDPNYRDEYTIRQICPGDNQSEGLYGMARQADTTAFLLRTLRYNNVNRIYFYNLHDGVNGSGTVGGRCRSQPSQCPLDDVGFVGADDDPGSPPPDNQSSPTQLRVSYCVLKKRITRSQAIKPNCG